MAWGTDHRPRMPLPEPSEQEGESVKAGQEPSPESPEPGTDVVPAAPTKPKEFSKLVLLAASTENVDEVDSQPEGGHCVMSLELSGPDTLARTPQILPVEEQAGTVQPTPQVPEHKRSKPDTGEFQACCPQPSHLCGPACSDTGPVYPLSGGRPWGPIPPLS